MAADNRKNGRGRPPESGATPDTFRPEIGTPNRLSFQSGNRNRKPFAGQRACARLMRFEWHVGARDRASLREKSKRTGTMWIDLSTRRMTVPTCLLSGTRERFAGSHSRKPYGFRYGGNLRSKEFAAGPGRTAVNPPSTHVVPCRTGKYLQRLIEQRRDPFVVAAAQVKERCRPRGKPAGLLSADEEGNSSARDGAHIVSRRDFR